MKTSFHVFYFCFVFSMPFSTRCQEMLKNPSFESVEGLPTFRAQFSKIRSWESRTRVVQLGEKEDALHSPDFYNNNGHQAGTGGDVKATNGESYVGALDYELFQQEMKVKPKKGEVYIGSFDFRKAAVGPGTVNLTGSQINIYLAKDRVYYKSEENYIDRRDCTDDYREKFYPPLGFQEIVKIANFNIDDYANFEWITEVYSFTVESDDFEFFVVEVDWDPANYGGITCSNSYTLFDNFSVMESCFHPCSPDLSETSVLKLFGDFNELDHTDRIIEEIAPLSPNQAALLGIINATYVRLGIKDEWGTEFYMEYYDPMGLHNSPNLAPLPNKKAFTLVWPGNWHGGHQFTSPVVMTYRVDIKSCNFEKYYTGVIAFAPFEPTDVYTNVMKPLLDYTPVETLNLEDCCEKGNKRILSNAEMANYENNQLEVEGFIELGNSVIQPPLKHVFYSGSFISILSGVDLNSHAHETGYADFSINTQCVPSNEGSELAVFEKTNRSQEDNNQGNNTLIYPNPVEINTPLVINVITKTSYQIYDMQGLKIQEGILKSGNNEVVFAKKGLFILRMNNRIYKILCGDN